MNASLADVGKFVALGGSFSTHAPSDHPKKWPDVWVVPDAAVVPEGTPIQLPPEVNSVSPAPELTVVLGEDLWRASPAEARAAVEGFTVSNDVSVKGEWPGYGNEDRDYITGTGYKIFPTFSPVLTEYQQLGVDEVTDLSVEATVDGVTAVEGSTSQMSFDISEALAHVSDIIKLESNDLVALGDPGNPTKYLDDAQTVTCRVESVGELTNPVERLS